MTTKTSLYRLKHIISAFCMILALLWLTVSTPFVFAAQQQYAAAKMGDNTQDDQSSNNPFASTTEEKGADSVNTLSEYLHDQQIFDHPVATIAVHQHSYATGLYIAFHGELISPPPDL